MVTDRLRPWGGPVIRVLASIDGFRVYAILIYRRLRINTKRRLAEHSMNFYRRALEGCMAVARLNLLERDS